MEQLRGHCRAEAAIIGGGLTSYLLGAALAQDGMRVAILTADTPADLPSHAGATLLDGVGFTRTAACRGMDAAQQYASALQTQLTALLASPPPYVQIVPAYLYAQTMAEHPALETTRALLTQLGVPVHTAPDAGGCPFPVELSLFSQGAVVDLRRWVAALSASIRHRGGRIFTGSRVTTLEGQRIFTAEGTLHAPQIILLTGKPPGLRNPALLALLESRTLACCTMTANMPIHSIQLPVKRRLSMCPAPMGLMVSMLLGRCGTRMEIKDFRRFEYSLTQLLPDFLPGEMHFFPHVFSADGLPVIGAMPGTRMLFASGDDAWGIPGAMHAAEVLRRHVLGCPRPGDALYTPSRHIPQRLTQRLLRARLEGMLHRGPLCSHCGCRMRYFTPAGRWACPGCGSACTMLGQPLSGPGMAPVQVTPRQRPAD